ncbi:MAG: LysE family translocator [Granulosicoccaceae bacterium]
MIDFSQAVAYIIALGIAAAIPGPGITALVARSVSSGAMAGFSMLLGLILGDLCYLSFAVFGLSLLAQSFSGLFVAIRWASIAYLCFLAWQFWHAQHHNLDSKAQRPLDLLSSAVSGLSITLGNPKTIAFYLALLPAVIDLESVSFFSWASVLVPLTIAVLLVVGGVFVLAALAVRRSLSSERAQRILHRGAAAAMASAAGSLAVREI